MLADLDKLLQTVGMATFVKYYDNFKNYGRSYCIAHFDETYTEKAKAARAIHARTIFNQNMEKDALLKIANAKRVGFVTKTNAIKLLETEFSHKI